MAKGKYVSPQNAKSPKARLDNLEVLIDNGQDSWALAKFDWDGSLAYGLRWNGNDYESGKGLGNPQSSGHATWVVLPEDIVVLLKKDPTFGPLMRTFNDDY